MFEELFFLLFEQQIKNKINVKKRIFFKVYDIYTKIKKATKYLAAFKL